MESPRQSPCPELRSGAAEGIGREGIVTIWDEQGRYLGCMGINLWHALVEAREAVDVENEELRSMVNSARAYRESQEGLPEGTLPRV